MWQAIYDSPVHHPGIAWLALVVSALVLASRQRFLYGYLVVFGLEMAADALASSPFLKMSDTLATVLSVVFVILGDFRFFLVAERCTEERGLTVPVFLRAFGLALVVPILSSLVRLGVPNVAATPRLQFLVYEALAVAVVVAYRVVLVRRLAAADPAKKRWAIALSHFVVVQYVLWVTCDVLLVVGFTPAYAVRVLPNIMYYALFLPAVYALAPRGEREPSRG